MKIRSEVAGLTGEVIALRRTFHRYPELGFQEYRTSEIIADYLEECGLAVRRIAKTGVVGLLFGKMPGRTLLLRADMDALPITEQNEVDYRSLNEGVMHACGHDGHMAMLLAAAKILAGYKDRLNGNIKFVFQPNEEIAGARTMIEEGVLDDPRVDAALAAHLWTPIKTGAFGIASGAVMAAHDNFKLVITGKGGHTSSPQCAVDPIIAAAGIIQTVQTVQTREIDALTPNQVIFGRIQGGTAPNIIPGAVELEGSLRWLCKDDPDSGENLRQRFERIVGGLCEAYRTGYSLEFIPSNPALVNDAAMAELVARAAEKTAVCPDSIVDSVCMAGEDFAEFALEAPAALYFIGTGNREKQTDWPHHHPRFNIDEDSLAYGVEMHLRTALLFLNGCWADPEEDREKIE